MHYCDSVRMLQWTRVLATAHQLRATSWCTVCSVGESGSGQQKLNCALSWIVIILRFCCFFICGETEISRMRWGCDVVAQGRRMHYTLVALQCQYHHAYLCACSHRDSRAGTNMRFACGRSTHTWGCCYTPLHAAPMQMREYTRRWHMLCSSERREFV